LNASYSAKVGQLFYGLADCGLTD